MRFVSRIAAQQRQDRQRSVRNVETRQRPGRERTNVAEMGHICVSCLLFGKWQRKTNSKAVWGEKGKYALRLVNSGTSRVLAALVKDEEDEPTTRRPARKPSGHSARLCRQETKILQGRWTVCQDLMMLRLFHWPKGNGLRHSEIMDRDVHVPRPNREGLSWLRSHWLTLTRVSGVHDTLPQSYHGSTASVPHHGQRWRPARDLSNSIFCIGRLSKHL